MGILKKDDKHRIFTYDFIFVVKLEEDTNLYYKGEITSCGKKGMFLCRDSRGFCWIETFINLSRFYKLEFNLQEGTFFVTARVYFRNPGEPFVLKKIKVENLLVEKVK